MIVFADNIEFGQSILARKPERWESIPSILQAKIEPLVRALFDSRALYSTTVESPQSWSHLFIVEAASKSQYDLLIELCRKDLAPPQPIMCVAGAGRGFHGFKERPWAAPAGNIYLSVLFAPERPVENFGAGFLILAAVSVIEAIDGLPGLRGRAGIKWVNDILIDGAKVCGVLAHTQAEGARVSRAILGIGLNVETTPRVEPTPFVPAVARLRDFAPHPEHCTQQAVFERLIEALDRNYRELLDNGYEPLLERYRRRSVVVGRKVVVCADPPRADREVIAEGRVAGIGKNLELLLEDRPQPITNGRLILQSANDT